MPVSDAGHSPASPLASFEIKSAQLSLVALLVKTSALGILVQEILAAYGPEGENPDFFDHDTLVIDLSAVPNDAALPDLKTLLEVLLQCRLHAVAVRGGPADWVELARSLGLFVVPEEVVRAKAVASAPSTQDVVVQEVVREVPGPATMVVDKPLRSGQKIYARGADLVVMAMVNQGAEVAADGNIHVYAPLRGRAMAGARGNTQARIFSLCMEPELVSIAGVYRTSENPLAQDVQGKPAQVRLSNDGKDKLIIEALKS